MTLIKRIFVAALLLVLPLAATAQDALTEDRVRELVRETILANPEILVEAIAILEERAAQERVTGSADMIAAQREQLEQDPNAPVLANADGDVTIVEFFDYNCPYCRRAAPTIENLVEADPGIRLVYREWPILGEGSVFAARAALASRQQGLYEEFHWAMMDMSGRAEERSVLTIAAEIGLDIDQLRADMESRCGLPIFWASRERRHSFWVKTWFRARWNRRFFSDWWTRCVRNRRSRRW